MEDVQMKNRLLCTERSKFLYKQIANKVNISNTRANYRLTLRKQKITNTLYNKRALQFKKENSLQVIPLLLVIDDSLKEKFRLRPNNLDKNYDKAIEFLNSSDIEYRKFGAFLFRRFFQDLSLEEERRENSGEKIEKFYIDFFLSKNMILSFEKILQCETNAIVINELLSCLVYFSYYESQTSQFAYADQFACDSFISIFKNLIQRNEGDLAAMGYVLVANLCISSDKLLSMIYQSDFLQTSFEKFKSGNANYTELIEAIRFFALLCKGEKKFSFEQVTKFIKIFDTACRPGEDEDTIFYSLGGILQFIKRNSEHQSELLNLIIQLNTLQKLLQCDDEQMQTRGRSFVFFVTQLVDYIIDAISPSIVAQFIESNRIFTSFSKFLSRIYPNELKRRIIDVINKIISLKDLRVIFLFANNPLAQSIANLLSSSDFSIISESCKILNFCFASCNIDILSLLHQHKVIDAIIQRMRREKDETNFLLLLQCVFYFLQNDNDKNSFAVYCASFGLEDVLNNQTNFTENHLALIDKIRTLLLNKIN